MDEIEAEVSQMLFGDNNQETTTAKSSKPLTRKRMHRRKPSKKIPTKKQYGPKPRPTLAPANVTNTPTFGSTPISPVDQNDNSTMDAEAVSQVMKF